MPWPRARWPPSVRWMSNDSGVAVAGRVPVRRRQRHDHLGVRGDDDVADPDVLGGVAERRVRHRRVPAHGLLDRARHQAGVGDQRVALLGMAQQRDGPVADQAGGGVVPGDDQLEDRGQHLLLGERAVAVGGDDEVGDQVLARLGALAVEQRGEVADDRRPTPPPPRPAAGPECGASRVRNHRPRSARSGSGMPSSSLITVNGSGNAKPATRSTTVVAAGLPGRRAGRRRSRGPGPPAPSTRRRLNAGVASRRSRVWSGGSTVSMCRASAGPGRPSATTSPLRASAACMSLDSRGSFSAARASSWPTTSQAGCPSARRDLVHRAGGAHLREQRERVVAVVVTPRVERRMHAAAASSSSVIESPGSRNTAGRSPPAARRRACRPRSGCRPSGSLPGSRAAGSGSAAGRRPPRPPTPRARRCRSRRTSRAKRAATSSRPWASTGPPGSRARSRTVSVSAAASRCGSRPATVAAIGGGDGMVSA